jgi:tyrosyl-tRNA synthetase
MPTMNSKISIFDKLLRRGLISGIYPESSEYREKLRQILANGKPSTLYTGFDATSNSLHIGNLATIMSSLHFHGHGHQVICVIGDATAQIGDPSGHTRDRKPIDKSVISSNAKAIETSLISTFENYRNNFFVNSKANQSVELKLPIIIKNSEWYKSMNLVDFVDGIFRDVRVGSLLHKKSIQERLKTNEGMNMAEFSYQILQAFDWLELRRRYDCLFQIGGNDQQGNIYTGHDLIKKRLGKTDSIGLLAPLITNAKGKKLGKTTEGSQSSIWLNPEQTRPFDLYQYFLRTPDDDAERFLRIFSFYEDDHIDDMIRNRLKDKSDIRYCQRKMAEHVCTLIHGQEGLNEAKRITESLFPTSKKSSKLI